MVIVRVPITVLDIHTSEFLSKQSQEHCEVEWSSSLRHHTINNLVVGFLACVEMTHEVIMIHKDNKPQIMCIATGVRANKQERERERGREEERERETHTHTHRKLTQRGEHVFQVFVVDKSISVLIYHVESLPRGSGVHGKKGINTFLTIVFSGVKKEQTQ